MSVLKYFKTTPVAPIGRWQALDVFFFFKFATRSLEKKGDGRPPTGDRGGLSPPSLRRPVGPAHRRDRGACRRHPRATGLYKHSTPIPFSFEPKNSTKNSEKKRGVRRREAAKSCRIPHL